jgi:hypothetical protein
MSGSAARVVARGVNLPAGGTSWKNGFVLPIGAQRVTTWLGSAAELTLLVRFWGRRRPQPCGKAELADRENELRHPSLWDKTRLSCSGRGARDFVDNKEIDESTTDPAGFP